MSIDLTAELMNENATAAADEVEGAAASSGELPAGKYAAMLDGASLKTGDHPLWELWFKVTAGQFAGRKVKYPVWTSTSENDKDGNRKTEEQMKQSVAKIKNEFFHTAGVLGLAVKTNGVYKFVPGKRDFRDVLGAQCVVKTRLRPATTPGDDRKFPEVEQFGVLSFADPKAKGVERPAAGSVPTHSAPPAEVKADDLADLASQV